MLCVPHPLDAKRGTASGPRALPPYTALAALAQSAQASAKPCGLAPSPSKILQKASAASFSGILIGGEPRQNFLSVPDPLPARAIVCTTKLNPSNFSKARGGVSAADSISSGYKPPTKHDAQQMD